MRARPGSPQGDWARTGSGGKRRWQARIVVVAPAARDRPAEMVLAGALAAALAVLVTGPAGHAAPGPTHRPGLPAA